MPIAPTAKPVPANTPERARRIAALWSVYPDMAEAEVAERVDADLAEEAARLEESVAWAREMADSVERMHACQVCGASAGWSSHTPLCQPCHRVAETLRAEEASAEQLAGRSRRDRVEQWLEAKAGTR